MPEGSCDPVGSPTLEQAPARTCGPMERGAHARAGLLAGLVTPWGTVSHQRDLMLEQGKSVRSPPPEGQGAAETMCDELTTTPIPHPLVPLGVRRQRNGSETEPGKKGGVEGRCFKMWFHF